MVVAQWLDVLQLVQSLLLFDIVRAAEGVGGGVLEAALHRQVRLYMLRLKT